MKFLSAATLFLLAASTTTCLGKVRRRYLEEVVKPEQLNQSCSNLKYEMFIAVEGDHMGIFAQPTRDIPEEELPEDCGPMFFHQVPPAPKEVGPSSVDRFLPGALYPLGDHNMTDILIAFDSVPNSDETYDIVTHHCAILILQMMCSLNIPLVQDMKDWAAGELMRTGEAKDSIVSMTRDSVSFDLLGIARNASAAASIRTLVEYDADMFYCPAVEETKADEFECSGSGNYFGTKVSMASLSAIMASAMVI
ncbi:expressed unknown protein [Seminavis robusta]|uniref:Uncharacterized protein n=1 Tax=Seminavis robusta TaxID=568900 RepID=A0A9N8DS68_9STRA|nr:expressed unknown protein [Seminavis robusta]|eukprot:Sro303_g112480.1 n/a (251) ;mRNA; f:63273-64025